MLKNEIKALDIGKIWMKKSLDDTHDYFHCLEVEKHALNIYPFFKKIDPTLDEELVKLAVWWHDCYKARQKKQTFKSLFFEGPLSEKIFFNEVGNLIEEGRAKRIGKAIRYHASPIYFFFNKYRMDTLINVLVEADQSDGFNIERNRRFLKQMKNPISKFVGYVQCLLIPIFMRLISRSQYSKQFFNLKPI